MIKLVIFLEKNNNIIEKYSGNKYTIVNKNSKYFWLKNL
jgi:hypothetical protein